MATNHNYKGLECTVVWADSPDGEQDVLISFLPEEDTVGDEEIFFYFTEEEVQLLLKAISERRERFSVNREWWIELMCDYALVCQ
jgi:hypothetical protein